MNASRGDCNQGSERRRLQSCDVDVPGGSISASPRPGAINDTRGASRMASMATTDRGPRGYEMPPARSWGRRAARGSAADPRGRVKPIYNLQSNMSTIYTTEESTREDSDSCRRRRQIRLSEARGCEKSITRTDERKCSRQLRPWSRKGQKPGGLHVLGASACIHHRWMRVLTWLLLREEDPPIARAQRAQLPIDRSRVAVVDLPHFENPPARA